jgi:hypothetical protein
MATFSVNDQVRRVVGTGDGSNDAFDFSFQVNATTDVKVYVDGTLKTAGSHYNVVNSSNASGLNTDGTGRIKFTGGNIPANAAVVTILSDVPAARTSVYTAGGNITATSLESDFDTQTMLIGDREERDSRALLAPVNDPTNIDMTIPAKDTRKGTVLGFNATTGNPEAGPTIADVSSLSAITADIAALADIEDGTTATDAISGLAAIKANVTTVAGVASNVTTVAGNTSNINAVAGDASDIGTVAGAISNVNTVAGISSNISTVAGNTSNINTVAGNNSNISTVAGNNSNVSTVAGISSDVTAVAGKATEIGRLGTADAVSDMNTLGTTAIISDMNTLAGISSDITATANVASSIAASGTNATNAANSATAAANSATAASNSQTAAAASAASAASAFDNFDDTYLGAKSSNPTQDNDGNSLVSGALYFNSTANEMRVYDGANWIAATSAGNVSLILYEYTATSNQTTFSGSDDNSATLSYTVDNLQVVMNGIVLDPSDFTATNGTSVVLAAGAATGDLINIYAFKSFTTADMVSKTNGGTFAGAVTFDAGANFGDNDKAQFGAGNDLQIYHDASHSYIVDAGTGNFYLSTNGNGIVMQASLSETMFAALPDGAVTLYHDNAAKLATSSTGVDITGGFTATDGCTITTSDNSTQLTLVSTDADANVGPILRLNRDSGSPADDDTIGSIVFNANNDASETTEYARLLTFIGDASNGSEDAFVQFDYMIGGTLHNFYKVGGGELVFNEDSKDVNFRVESDGNANMIHVDAGNNLVGIGMVPDTTALTVSGQIGTTNGTEGAPTHSFYSDTDTGMFRSGGDTLAFSTGGTTRTTIDSSGNVLVGTTSVTPNSTVDGFLAHETQTVVPEAITGTHNEVETWTQQEIDDGDAPDGTSAGDNKLDGDGNTIPVMQGIDQSKLVPLLTAALKESIAKIETLETKVAALEAGS